VSRLLWITKDELASYSSILADRVAANTDKGITAVAEEIDRVVSSAVDTPSWIAPTPLRRLKLLVDEPVTPDRIVRFRQHHPNLLVGGTGENAIFGPNILADLRVANGVISIAAQACARRRVFGTLIRSDSPMSMVDSCGRMEGLSKTLSHNEHCSRMLAFRFATNRGNSRARLDIA